ncbi:MAG TPA: anti-anti-sigma factor [Xanthomonadaceae bacterium]|jgi:ABC-type transporter Mla MlaB component|nr:anti-anti-sigma factor [Xanthomonadaceae bacterium]
MARKMVARTPAPAQDAESHIQLGAQLGIEDADGLHRQLVAAVDDPRPVVLEGRDVQNIHTAALELFCLFCRDRRAAGRETRWQEPSEALRSAAALLGITALMALAQQGGAP